MPTGAVTAAATAAAVAPTEEELEGLRPGQSFICPAALGGTEEEESVHRTVASGVWAPLEHSYSWYGPIWAHTQ